MKSEEKRLNVGKERKKRTIAENVSDSFIYDRLSYLSYRKLSRQEEIDFIKKTKLSFYYSLEDEDEKRQYLEYYMEMFPNFRKSWNEAKGKEKDKLLHNAIQDSTYYRDKFLENNYRLVLSVAKTFPKAYEVESLYQEGILGMIRALKKFDLSRGTRFSTYAVLWIRQFIARFIYDYSSTIRVPVHRREQIYQLEKVETEFINRFGRSPSKEELASALGIDLEQLNEIKESQSFLYLASLSTPVGEENDDDTLEEFIADSTSEFSSDVENNIMREAFRDAIENDVKLSERDKEVLYWRFGFYDGRPHTLDEIGKYFNVSKERIRQIEAKSLRLLRYHFAKTSFRECDFSLGNVSFNDDQPKPKLKKKNHR